MVETPQLLETSSVDVVGVSNHLNPLEMDQHDAEHLFPELETDSGVAV